MRPAALDDAGRDAVEDALRRGRARLAAAAADPAALQRMLARLSVRDWRRSTLSWLALRHPDQLESAFTLGEIAWLGAEDSPAPAGRAADVRLPAPAPDLHLRVAELLSELGLPARLAPAVLTLAAQDEVDGVAPAYLEDRVAVARYARAPTRTRVEDYVSALVGHGPLV